MIVSMRRSVCAFTIAISSLFAQGTIEVNGRLIRYEVRGGYAIVQGDIIIGTAAEVEQASRGVKAGEPQSVVLRFDTSNPQRWPDATMYYSIDPAIPNPQRLLDAVEHWNTRTHLKILPRTNQTNYVRFVNNTT